MGGFLSRRDGGNRGNPFKILIFPEISLAFFQNDILLKETKTEYRSEINQIQRRIMLDKTDKAILRLLQQNARMPNAEIARKIKLAPSAVLKRIQRMEQEKIITGYEAKIDPRGGSRDRLSPVLHASASGSQRKPSPTETPREKTRIRPVSGRRFFRCSFFCIFLIDRDRRGILDRLENQERLAVPDSESAELAHQRHMAVFLRGDECFPVLGAALHDGDQLLHDHVKRSGPDDSAGAVHRGENLAPAGNRHGIGNAWLHDGDRSDCGTRVRIFSGEFPRGPAGACFGIKLVNRGSLREKSRDSRQRSCRNDLVDAVCLRLSPGHQLFPARGNHPASIGSSLEPDDLPCSFPDGARFLRMERGFGTCQPEPCDDHAVSDSDHDNPHGMGPARRIPGTV